MAAKLQINLSNLKFNIDKIKEKLYENQELLVMVKAEAYGAGLVEVTKILKNMEQIDIVRFTGQDVVRHKLVQDIIRAYEKYEEAKKRK